MTDLDFESSQLQLLTDALRAGPGTPEWRAALDSINAGGGGDEYKALYAARERLASGRQYREVRAGPGFTRRVFDAIDQDNSGQGLVPRALPAANLIAAISALVILGVLAGVAWLIIPGAASQEPANDLSQTYFVNRIAEGTFETALGAEWTAFGKLPVEAKDGLRPAGAADSGERTGQVAGGGVVYRRTIQPNQPFALELTVKLPKASDDAAAVVLFVTDTPTFDGASATSPHELAWLLRGNEASVALPDGTIASTAGAGGSGTARVRDGQRVEARIAVNRVDASVEMNGRRLWSGENQLDPSNPRTVGVRLLKQGKLDEKATPVVESLRVLVPQKQ